MKRVVTVTGEDGRSTILSADEAPLHRWGRVFWPAQADDRALADLAPGDVTWRSYVVNSTAEMDDYVREHYHSDGAGASDAAPGAHTTPTTDFLMVLDGVLDLVLDDTMVRLAAGDVVVQQATRHAWRFIETPVRYAVLSIRR